MPIEAGTWPAIWMLGKNVNEDGGYFDATYGTSNWPACGEIDIMEHGITRSQPINYIQSALHTPSSYGNTTDIGGVVANSDIANNYHIYSMNWSPNQISFLLDNVIYYTYNPTVRDASTWPFDKEQYLLLNIAMGGVAGPIASNFAETSMVIDYVRVYQNTTIDTQAPTNFTATIGAITGSSVELLLNATDNSGTVTYNVDYGSGTNSTSFSSGVQKSVIIQGLSPNTNYSFTVSATDASGNAYPNNPIILQQKQRKIPLRNVLEHQLRLRKVRSQLVISMIFKLQERMLKLLSNFWISIKLGLLLICGNKLLSLNHKWLMFLELFLPKPLRDKP